MTQYEREMNPKGLRHMSRPAYPNRPPVYQPPNAPQDYELEQTGKKRKSSDGNSTMVSILLIILAAVAAILYLSRQAGDPNPGVRSSTAAQQSSAIAPARVNASSLYLRAGPGTQYEATYLLPQNWQVSMIGEPQTAPDGEVWVRVRLDTQQGVQEGWVNRKYLTQ
jgi:hypothetical protein